MFRRSAFISIFAVAGCAKLVSYSNDTPFQAQTTGANFCAGGDGTLEVQVARPGFFYVDKDFVAPQMTLRKGDAPPISVSAQWSDDHKSFRVAVPKGLEVGKYDLVLTRAYDKAQKIIAGAVDVADVPQITSVDGIVACAESAAPKSVTVYGAHLANASVSLEGLAKPATVTSRGDSQLTFLLPDEMTIEKTYPLIVSGNSSCTARFEPGVSLVGKPTISGLAFGPKLNSGAADRANRVTVRLTGANLPAGAKVKIGTKRGIAVATSGVSNKSSIDVTFEPNTLDSGNNQAVTVELCETSAPSLDISASTIKIVRTNPNAVASSDGGAYVDIVTETSLSGSVTFAINTNTSEDPIAAPNWVELANPAKLDKDGKWFRAQLPLSFPIGNGKYDVRVVNGAAEALAVGFINGLATGTIPRLIYKDKDSVTAGIATTVNIYGCGFDGGAAAELLDASGAVIKTMTLNGVHAADAFGANNFTCKQNSAVTQAASVNIPSDVAAGIYRLRLTKINGSTVTNHEGLYPLIVYNGASALSSFQNSGETLATPRKNPQSAIAFSASGRKFIYIVGGALVATSDPTDTSAGGVTSVASTYEYSPIGPSHELLGFTEKPLDSDTPIGALSLAQSSYGGALVADAKHLYWLGGTSNSSSGATISSVVYHTKVQESGELERWSSPALGLTTVNLCMSSSGASNFTCTGAIKTYGLSAQIINNGVSRQLVAMGGLNSGSLTMSQNRITELVLAATLGADGIPVDHLTDAGASGAGTSGPHGQAFAAMDNSHAAAVMQNYLGLFSNLANTDGTISDALQTVDVGASTSANVIKGTALSDPQNLLNFAMGSGATPARIQLPEVGVGMVHAGTRSFFFGGVNVGYSDTDTDNNFDWNELRWGDPAFPRNRVMTVNDGSGASLSVTAANQPAMKKRRAYQSTVHLPPYVYLISGVTCKYDDGVSDANQACDQTGDRQLTTSIEVTTVQ